MLTVDSSHLLCLFGSVPNLALFCSLAPDGGGLPFDDEEVNANRQGQHFQDASGVESRSAPGLGSELLHDIFST